MSAGRSLIAGPLLPAILCLGLGAGLYLEIARPSQEPGFGEVPPAGQGAEANVAVRPLFDLPPVEAFMEVVERPLFSPTRRLPADVAADPEPVADTPVSRGRLEVTVVGIITGPRALALLRSGSGDRLVPLAEGEQLAGWTLTAIEPFRLVFRRDEDEQVFEIEYRER